LPSHAPRARPNVLGEDEVEFDGRKLSDRERTVLLLAAEGFTDKEIAKHLNLSQRTVGTYWERIRQKLGQHPRSQLVARFVRGEFDLENAPFRKLFGAWDHGIWILTPAGETIYANPNIAALFGLSVDEFNRRSAKEIFATCCDKPLSSVLEQACADPQTVDFTVDSSEGPTWLSMRASAVSERAEEPAAIILFIQDSTVQERVRQTLGSCEQTLQFLYDHSSDLIARFDRELRCVTLNPSLQQILNGNGRKVEGRPLLELDWAFQPVEQWEAGLREAFRTRQIQSFATTLRGLKGTVTTHLLPEPSERVLPDTVMSITVVGSQLK
jgi:PAS domain S-box-containing protein